MRQTTAKDGKLFLLGGDNLRFLIEEPVRLALDGLSVINIEKESDLTPDVDQAIESKTPVCLVVRAESLTENVEKWVNRMRNRFPWLPIVLLDHCNSRIAGSCGLPQLVESVAIIKYPYTQKAVIEAIEKAIWWSMNLCRMLERVTYFANLSERELAIVSMATDGVPNKSMARRLEVSIKTIEKNRRTAYEKLKISSSAEMAALVTFRRYFSQPLTEPSLESKALPIPNMTMPTTLPIQILE